MSTILGSSSIDDNDDDDDDEVEEEEDTTAEATLPAVSPLSFVGSLLPTVSCSSSSSIPVSPPSSLPSSLLLKLLLLSEYHLAIEGFLPAVHTSHHMTTTPQKMIHLMIHGYTTNRIEYSTIKYTVTLQG